MIPLHKFYSDYVTNLKKSLGSLCVEELDLVITELKQARLYGTPVFVMGNGGSATISEHLQCDWFKGVGCKTGIPLQVKSLVSNTGLLTALANDFSYEEVFSKQLELERYPHAVAIFISSSGNSPNIIKAIKQAKKTGYTTVGLTGFTGGKLKKLCDYSLHIEINNYGIVEDSHQAIMHIISQYLQL